MKIGIFQANGWEKDYLAKSLTEHEVVFFDQPLNQNSLPEDKDFDAISVFVGSDLSSEVLQSFPNLKLITTRSTGYDHIDIATAQERQIQVGYVPAYGENTVAEHAFGLILTLSHRLYEAYDRLRTKGIYSFEGLEGFDLAGKTLGVIGTGNIGQHSIKIAHGFSMKVIAFDAFPKPELAQTLNFTYKQSLDELLMVADIITIHVPYLKATHHLINKDNINRMKAGAILINTARGAIVETEALVKALQSGHLGGAGLDVLEEEGVLKDELGHVLSGDDKSDLKVVLENHILIDMPNVIVTPHSAFNTREARERILDTTIENINSFAQTAQTANPVKPQ